MLDNDVDDDVELIARVKTSVQDLMESPTPVETLEQHPLVRKTLCRYAHPKLSRGFAHPASLYSSNSNCEIIAELPSVQGTPPTVRFCLFVCLYVVVSCTHLVQGGDKAL